VRVLFFQVQTWMLALILLAVILAATVVSLLIGRSARKKSEVLREPFSVMQAVLLGFMSLVLAFGLSLAVGRYQDRRSRRPSTRRTRSARRIGEQRLSMSRCAVRRWDCCASTRTSVSVSLGPARTVPRSGRQIADSSRLQRQLWDLAGQSLNQAPIDSAPRLYVESLTETFDSQETRVSSLSNRVPTAVLVLELVVAAIALASLGLHLSTMGRGVFTVLVAVLLVASTLLVTFDLDRPTRGLIRVPDGPLTAVRASMDLPPAAPAPTDR
jgi:hypothetical protein